MFTHPSESSILEDIIRKDWPNQTTESAVNNTDSDWDILTDLNTGDASHRHWFKQNFINQLPQHTSIVIYH